MNLDKQVQQLRELRSQISSEVISEEKPVHRFTVVKPVDMQAKQREARQAEIAKREAREKKFSKPLTFKMGTKF